MFAKKAQTVNLKGPYKLRCDVYVPRFVLMVVRILGIKIRNIYFKKCFVLFFFLKIQ